MRTHTDPAVIREVLADADATSTYAAGRKHDLAPRTITRWMERRTTMGRPWPTDQDVAEWRAEEAATGERRARLAAKSDDYRKRVYLNRGPVQVSSLGTARRLQALFANGWTTPEMGERLGVSAARVGHLMTPLFETVFPGTAASVAALYDELHMTVPPPRVGAKGLDIRGRTRRAGVKRGYSRPLMWDNIDDPDETPSRSLRAEAHVNRHRHRDEIDRVVIDRVLNGEKMHTTRAERPIILRRWLDSGRSEKALCDLLGWYQGRVAPADDDQLDEAV